MVTGLDIDIDSLRRLVGEVPDPEVPVLTIADLGVLRSVELADGDTVIVTITPTYSGCPAMHHIEQAIRGVLAAHGVEGEVRTVYDPAWTTDWMSADGRAKLRDYGIAPPRQVAVTIKSPTGSGPAGTVRADTGPHPTGARSVECPRCGSGHTETVSWFGSTACKSLHRCLECREPFDHFKEL